MINVTREKILHKGYAKKSDIRKFIPCGHERSVEIYEEIREQVEDERKVNLQDSIISKRLLPYIGLTEKQVIEYATKEKVDAATSTRS